MDSVTGYHQTIIIKKAKNGLNIGINNYQECTLSRLFQIDWNDMLSRGVIFIDG